MLFFAVLSTNTVNWSNLNMVTWKNKDVSSQNEKIATFAIKIAKIENSLLIGNTV